MKVLLDECVDWRLARDIVGHEVKTARQMGWTTLKNGELLTLASRHFDVFVTVDRNLAFQQNVSSFSIAVLVLMARSNRLADLRVRLKTFSRITELSQHDADGGEFQEREGAAIEIFPVLGEAAATVEPRNRAFDDPTLG